MQINFVKYLQILIYFIFEIFFYEKKKNYYSPKKCRRLNAKKNYYKQINYQQN